MSALYGLAREAFLGGDIQWDADDIRCILVDTGTYTVSIDTHQFITLGVADAADITVTGVTGLTTEAVVIYAHTGVEGTSKLIAYIDNAGVVLTPNGGDVTIQWDNGVNKIFKL